MKEGEPRNAFRWAAVIGGILIAAAIIALYTPWVHIFDLRKIVVTGNYHTSAAEIKDGSGVQNGTNLLRIPLARARASLLQLPWIMDVSFRRILPHTLKIAVREREPVAVVVDPSDSERLLVLGEDGVIVGYVKDPGAGLIVISGVAVTSDPASGRRNVEGYVTDTLGSLQEHGTIELFRRIDFSDPEAVVMYTDGDVEVILGPVGEVDDRLDELTALLKTIDLEDYRTIDLRFGGEARLVPRKVVNR